LAAASKRVLTDDLQLESLLPAAGL